MKQAILQEKETIVFSETEKPELAEGEVLLKVKNIGICGSDIHAYYGAHPFVSLPIRLGHEASGEIASLGAGVRGLKVGQTATYMPQLWCGHCKPCLEGRYNICESLKVIGCQTPGAACEYLSVPAHLIKVMPKELDARLAATVEPAAVGVHAVRRSEVKGKNVVVMGAGTIGNVTAQAAMAEGAKSVLITDLSDYRLKLAHEKCGIPHTANTGNMSLGDAVDEAFGNEGADVFFECVGIGATVDSAIQCARKGTDIVIVGVYGKNPVVNLAWVQDREFRLIGALMYMEKDFQDTIDYMAAGKIKMEPLISKVFKFDEYGEAFKYIEKNKDTSLKILLEV